MPVILVKCRNDGGPLNIFQLTLAIADERVMRSEVSLVQTFGRASRNAGGAVILYADRITRSMRAAMDVTHRRRELQERHNEEHGIVPTTIIKAIPVFEDDPKEEEEDQYPMVEAITAHAISAASVQSEIETLHGQMLEAANRQDFEEAATLRDRMRALEAALIASGVE